MPSLIPNNPPLHGSPTIDSDQSRLLNQLVQSRILPVVAAGNEAQDACAGSPAASAW